MILAIDWISTTVYLAIWAIFAVVCFVLLRAMRLEKLFQQGKIFEIRLAYTLFTIIFSYLSTEAFVKIFRIFGINI